MSANCATRCRAEDLLPGIASLFNGALFRASTLEAVGVPDLRLFMRGDEVETPPPAGALRSAVRHVPLRVYLHPHGADEFKPILGGRMHTQYPDDPNEAVLHVPQPRLRAVAARAAPAAAAGVAAVRLVLPGVAPRPRRTAGMDSAAPARAGGEVRPAGGNAHDDYHRRRRRLQDVPPGVRGPGRRAGNVASCGCTSAGRTSSSATDVRCWDRSGSRSPPGRRRSRWAGCTPSCSISSCPSICPT